MPEVHGKTVRSSGSSLWRRLKVGTLIAAAVYVFIVLVPALNSWDDVYRKSHEPEFTSALQAFLAVLSSALDAILGKGLAAHALDPAFDVVRQKLALFVFLDFALVAALMAQMGETHGSTDIRLFLAEKSSQLTALSCFYSLFLLLIFTWRLTALAHLVAMIPLGWIGLCLFLTYTAVRTFYFGQYLWWSPKVPSPGAPLASPSDQFHAGLAKCVGSEGHEKDETEGMRLIESAANACHAPAQSLIWVMQEIWT